MNKEKFLKDLEKKLSLLSEEEKKDIINEYSDIIEEKIKHGKNMEEAINEFGDIDLLSKEILKTYKINPNYNKSDFSDKTSDFIKSSEDLIKKGAKKLTDITEEIVDSFKKNDKEISTNNVFEIIIKVFLVLICLAFLKLPFYIISEIGSGIFDIGFSPFNHFSLIAWKVLVELVYLAVCILLVVVIVNKFTKKNNENNTINDKISKEKQGPKMEEIKEENKELINEEKTDDCIIKKEKKIIKNSNSQSNDAFGTFLLTFIKIWCIVLILVPIWSIEIVMMTSIILIIYLIIKGIEIYGILLLMIGITAMFGYFADLLYKLLFSKKNVHIYPVFINIVLIVIGALMTFDYMANLKFVNTIPTNFKEVKENFEIKIIDKTEISNVVEKLIDNTLENNILRFEVTYYSDVFNVEKPILIDRKGYSDYITFSKQYKNKEYSLNNMYIDNFIDNLKENRIYNYGLLWQVRVKVYSNEATLNMYD